MKAKREPVFIEFIGTLGEGARHSRSQGFSPFFAFAVIMAATC